MKPEDFKGEIQLKSATKYYKENLESIPKRISPKEAANRGYFVYDCVEEKVYNKDVLDRFVRNTEINSTNRIADEIIIVIYTTNGEASIYNLGYNYIDGIGYVLATDLTRIKTVEYMDYKDAMKYWEQYNNIIINTDIPGEYYGICVTEDKDFDVGIISLKVYSNAELEENKYKDIEIARYLLDAKFVDNEETK